MTTIPPRSSRQRAFALALSGLSAVGTWSCASLARAQDVTAVDLERQQPVRLGDSELFPSLRLDYLYDDNVGLRADDQVDGSSVLISPRLDFVADSRQATLRASYLGGFSQGSEDSLDFADHRLGLDVDVAFGSRQRAALNAYASRRHQEFGTELTRGLADQFTAPVEFNQTALDASYTYGAEDARANVVAGFRAADISYVSLPQLTAGRDYTRIGPYAQFAYRLGGSTRAILQASFESFDFDADFNDRTELGFGAGLRFAATGRLRGGFLLGVTNASFDDPGIDDDSAFTANADLVYALSTLSTLRLDVTREFDNITPTRVGTNERQSLRTTGRLGWNRQWSERFQTNAFAQLIDVSRACPDLPTTTVSGGIEADLSVRRWLQVGASAALASRSSDDCGGDGQFDVDTLEYDQALYGVHVRVTL